MERKHTLIDNAAEKRYELDLGDGMALAEYVLGHGLIVLTHTEVPPKYEGRGIGKELVQGVLEDAAHCIKLLGGRVEEPFDYAIPGAGVTHRVIPIRKAAPTLKGYPRRWAKIQKAPL